MFPLLTLEQFRGLEGQTKEYVLHQFLSDITCINYHVSFNGYQHVFNNEFQETCHPTVFATFTMATLEDSR